MYLIPLHNIPVIYDNIISTKNNISCGIIYYFLPKTNKYTIEYIQNNIQFIMVQKRLTYQYMSLINGKYNINNYEQLNNMFSKMTSYELNMIKSYNYDKNINFFRNSSNKNIRIKGNNVYNLKTNDRFLTKYDLQLTKIIYKKKIPENKEKFNELKRSSYYNSYLSNIVSLIDTNWEFPKGKKSKNETDLDCAYREFFEETKIKIIDNIKDEYIFLNIVGTDNKIYKYKFYLYESQLLKNYEIDKTNMEIKNIEWINFNMSKEFFKIQYNNNNFIDNIIEFIYNLKK